jgi:hypothetical protein
VAEGVSEVTGCSTEQDGEEVIVEYNSMRYTLYIIKLRQPIFTSMLRLMKIRQRQLPYSEFCVLNTYFRSMLKPATLVCFTMPDKF